MSQLTGRPAIGGTVRPYCYIENPVADEWTDMSEYLTRRGGEVVRRGPERWQGRWTLGWGAMTPQEALDLRSDLMAVPLLFTPRTRATGDPDYLAEETFEVYVTSDLETLQPVWRGGKWRVSVALEAVETVPEIPNRFDGGYDLVAETEATATLDPYDAGTIDDTGEQITIPYDGTVYEIDLARLGTDAVVAMRVEEVTDTHVRIAVRRPDPPLL